MNGEIKWIYQLRNKRIFLITIKIIIEKILVNFMRLGKLSLIFILLLIPVGLGLSDDAFGNMRDSIEPLTVKQTNEYSNYIHFQPEWKSYPRNLILDVNTTWDRIVVPGEEEDTDYSNHGAKQRQNGLHYVNSKPVVLVQYDYMNCQTQWFHYAKTGLDFLGYQFDLLKQHKSIHNTIYSDESQSQKLKNGFAQFVPICTSKDSTNYKYSITVDDDKFGFDVFFVPSYAQQWNYFLYPDSFEYFSEPGCYGQNYQKFYGQCMNVGKDSGLLIVIPDELHRPMTKITIKLDEIN